MNKETEPKILIVGGTGSDRAIAAVIASRILAKTEIILADSIGEVDVAICPDNLSICPVGIPPMLKLRNEPKDNGWRGGSTKKGGKAGYERR